MTEKEVIDIGLSVECDMCSRTYRSKDGTILVPETGGILFGSKAVGPCCAGRIERSAKRYGESSYIKARCPENVPFAEWCIGLRGGDNTITITTF